MLMVFLFIIVVFFIYNAAVLLSKINVKKGKIIHFCEIAFTDFRRSWISKSFHRRNFGFRTGNFGFHRRNLNFRTGNFFRKISFKYNGLWFHNNIICLITLTGSVPDKWHHLIFYFYFRLWTASDCFVQSRNAAFIWNA